MIKYSTICRIADTDLDWRDFKSEESQMRLEFTAAKDSFDLVYAAGCWCSLIFPNNTLIALPTLVGAPWYS